MFPQPVPLFLCAPRLSLRGARLSLRAPHLSLRAPHLSLRGTRLSLRAPHLSLRGARLSLRPPGPGRQTPQRGPGALFPYNFSSKISTLSASLLSR
jgi:hypothetical protein